MAELEFRQIPQEVADATGAEGWRANHGSFVFTIVTHPAIHGEFETCIAYVPGYLPRGPFSTLADAVAACNHAADVLGN